MDGCYVKVVGVKFDALYGLQIVNDANRKNFEEAGVIADQENDGDTIFICIPCTYKMHYDS